MLQYKTDPFGKYGTGTMRQNNHFFAPVFDPTQSTLEQALHELKVYLVTNAPLHYPTPNAPFTIMRT